MRRFLLALAILVVFTSVKPCQAQYDVYCICSGSDTGCGGNLDIPAFSQRTIYFVLMNPSASSVSAWEARIDVGGNGSYVGSWVLSSGLNVSSDDSQFIVGLGANFLGPNSGGLVVLMSMNLLVLDELPITFKIGGIPGSDLFDGLPGYVLWTNAPNSEDPEFDIYSCETCSGSEYLPDFSINSAIEDEDVEWGKVKTIYGR